MKPFTITALLTLITAFASAQTPIKSWRVSNMLTVHQITPHTYIHESKLVLDNGDSVNCNGILYSVKVVGLLVDTPADSATTDLLIRFFQDSLNIQIRSALVSHFHVDALGGLDACNAHKIFSQGYWTTQKLAKKEGFTPPKSRVKSSQTMLGTEDQSVILYYPGQGHTKDNSVFYIPEEKVLFGGCLIKCLDAGYGNLEDANLKKWPESIENVQAKFPEAEIVIPGHGAYGNQELLEYTKTLFLNYNVN